MKTKLISFQPDQVGDEKRYPYIGVLCGGNSQCYSENLMVLFVAYRSGICIRQGNTFYKEGIYRDAWMEENFIRFNGKIVLEISNED
jgi:hypothetical protein